jgi:hypothetical protein
MVTTLKVILIIFSILFAMGAIAESDKKAQNQHAYTFIFTVSMTVMVFFLL